VCAPFAHERAPFRPVAPSFTFRDLFDAWNERHSKVHLAVPEIEERRYEMHLKEPLGAKPITEINRHILSDLRESGSLEQDADIVCFIYRDEYYAGEESDQQGLAEVICAKHRNGPTGAEKLSFLKRYAKFADLAA